MSHGGGESGRVHEKLHQAKKRCGGSGDEFSLAIARIAVAQICEIEGFQTFQQSALEMLSHVTIRYIQSIGKTAQFYANLAGRTESNAFDIIQALEELSSAQGFSGASDVNHCLACSGAVKENIQYIGEADNGPFAYSVPRFPVVKERKSTPSFLQIGEESPWNHIPAWLPKFPDSRTYIQLFEGTDGTTDFNMEKSELRRHTNTDMQVLNLKQQFTCNGSERPTNVATGEGAKEKWVAGSNPYLATPLQFGEKEVSYIVPPPQLSNEIVLRNPPEQNHVMDNHVSVLGTFSPAIEAMKNILSDSEEGQKKVLFNQRPLIKFKMGLGKKSLDLKPDLSPQNKDAGSIGLWFGKDITKEEKKRRAEEILKQSTENPGELLQL